MIKVGVKSLAQFSRYTNFNLKLKLIKRLGIPCTLR